MTAFTRFRMTLVVVLLAGGCGSDEVMSPGTGPGTLMAAFVPVAGGTVTVPIPNQATPEGQAALPAFSRRTLLRATMTGSVDIQASPYNPGGVGLPPPGQPRTVGLPGFKYNTSVGYDCGAQLRVYYGSLVDVVVPCVDGTSSDTLVSAQGYFYAQAGEAGTAMRTAGRSGAWNCTNSDGATGPCWYYSTSGQTVTIERVTADFDLTATPTTVNYNDTVTVTASVSPAQEGGLNVPWTIDSVRWTPAFGTQNAPYSWNLFVPNTGDAPSRTCRRPFTRSGTLTVSATVNGDVKQKSVAIDVTPPKLTLTATPQAVQPGGSVTFSYTVTGTGGAWVGNPTWVWQPDSGQAGDGISSPCYSQNPCTRALTKSGIMTLTVVVYPGDGSADALSASAHVSVVPCPTGREPLDQPMIRQALVDAHDRLNSTDQEQVVPVFHDPSGYFVLSVPTSYASACKAVWTPPSPTSFPGTDLIAIAHTHRGKPGTAQWCPEFGNYTAGEGGSGKDWQFFKQLQNEPSYQSAGWSDLEYWIIDGDYVYVMEPGKSRKAELKPGTTQFS